MVCNIIILAHLSKTQSAYDIILISPCSQEVLRSLRVRHSITLLTFCSACYSFETTDVIFMKLHTCIGVGIKLILNEIYSDWENKMAARQPYWIFNIMGLISNQNCTLYSWNYSWYSHKTSHMYWSWSLVSKCNSLVIENTRWLPGIHLEFSLLNFDYLQRIKMI